MPTPMALPNADDADDATTDDDDDADDEDGAGGDADDGEAPVDPKVRAADLLHRLRTRMLDLV